MSKQRKQSPREAARPETRVDAFEDVVSLIKERRKYADWIAALEAKRDQTPAGVYAKVHLDYETRLQAVVDKLAEHRGALTDEQDTLRKRLEEVQGQIEHHEEQRSETELRAHVGELSAAALTEALRVADTELERLQAKRSSIEADLARIAEFFAAAEGTGSIPSPARKPKSAGGFDELGFLQSVVGAERGEGGQERKSEPRIEATSAPAAEGPPPLRPVEVPPTPPAEVPAPPRPTPPPAPPRPSTPPAPEPRPSTPPTPPPPVPPEPPTVPIAPPRTTIERPVSAAAAEVTQADGAFEKATELDSASTKPVPRQSIAMQMASLTIEPGSTSNAQGDLGIIKTGDELPPSILADLNPGAGGQKPLAANVASNDPFTLTASPGSTKNLKCKACGALNLPSDWYCEGCGAELSVI